MHRAHEDAKVRFRSRRAAAVFGLLLLAVGGAYLGAYLYTREPPNYDRVEDGLWLGGFVPEPPSRATAVLNLCESEDPYRAAVHKWEPIRDAAPAPTLDWLRAQVDWIAEQRAAGRGVYVHCRNGVSRSGMVVVAFVMARDRISRDEAMARVREKRAGLRPNPAFRELLTEWEAVVLKR
jgi:hypothetical protein